MMTACNKRPGPEHPMYNTGVACHYRDDHDPPCAWSVEPSLARKGFDRLLAAFPFRTVQSVDSQPAQSVFSTDTVTGEVREVTRLSPGPWVCVTFVGGAEYAIWKSTGNVYQVDADGAAAEDPVLTVDG
jgi:hypothetical protein